jgi:hypothetical protein
MPVVKTQAPAHRLTARCYQVIGCEAAKALCLRRGGRASMTSPCACGVFYRRDLVRKQGMQIRHDTRGVKSAQRSNGGILRCAVADLNVRRRGGCQRRGGH